VIASGVRDGLEELSMGMTDDFEVAVEEGATLGPHRPGDLREGRHMAGFWKRALLYLGLVEEDDELEPITEWGEPPSWRRCVGSDLRPIRHRRSGPAAPDRGPSAVLAGPMQSSPTVIPAVPRIHVVEPRSFNDAKDIGDKLRVDSPVVRQPAAGSADLARRIVDFSSGLTYMASGTIRQVADKIFLLTPPNVEVSAEETERIMSERGFFNQF
jgi:cell division inhibitor SepF